MRNTTQSAQLINQSSKKCIQKRVEDADGRQQPGSPLAPEQTVWFPHTTGHYLTMTDSVVPPHDRTLFSHENKRTDAECIMLSGRSQSKGHIRGDSWTHSALGQRWRQKDIRAPREGGSMTVGVATDIGTC